jgi:hypothetical protein
MSFEQSPFGDGSASGSGNVTTTVSTHFGVRDSKFANGVVKTEGYTSKLSLYFDHVAATAGELVLLNPVIPAGARITSAVLITKVQGVGATGVVLDVGTDTSEATNGFSITEAQLEAAADTVVDLTSALSGTWDAEAKLAADTTVNLALSVAALTAGEWEAEITYVLERA